MAVLICGCVVNATDACRLLAVNAVSLVFALVSNASLLLNMARRLPFRIAQPITIVGWFVASFLLIGLVSVMETPALHKEGVKDQALTQAYYYGIMAAVLYFFVASLMVVNVWGAYRGQYSKEFNLTISQRTLMLQTISFLAYMHLGALAYAHIEGWEYLDAVYWADFTLLTIGTGDYAPSTHLGRGLLFPYAIGGIIILGLVVGSIRSLVLERGKKKMGARMTEKARERVLKKIGNDDSKSLNLDPIEKGQEELRRREREFKVMRKVQSMASTRRKWISLLVSGGAWFILWFIGAVVFWKAEKSQNWTYFQSLYFAYVSLLTIGYGDFHPYSNSGKAFFVFWSLLAIPTLTILISNMGDTVVKVIKNLTLWLGEVTFLPGDAGMKDRLLYGMHKATGGRFKKGDVEDMTGSDANTRKKSPRNIRGKDRIVAALEKEELALEKEELAEEEESREKGDDLGEDIHHYHYLLVKEIRNVYPHFSTNPDKTYTFDEWAWFLKLIGEDESSAKFHRAAIVNAKDKKDRDQSNSKPDLANAAKKEEDEEIKQWSWLGNRSPLMGDKGEPEWVLERLCQTLEKEMKAQREASRKGNKREKPPVGSKDEPLHRPNRAESSQTEEGDSGS
jgi:potassium channel subfamily K, other eukaryote